jgi:hypothetical protein
MSKDLMAPRYKVIAGWPRGGFPVGLVFTGTTLNDLNKSVIECDKYPHLFKKLEWHEERTAEWFEQVKYLRYGELESGYFIYEVLEWDLFNEEQAIRGAWSKHHEDYYLPLSTSQKVYPATKEEFENFINSKK